MEKIKILNIFGTRPEASKMCPLVNEMKKHNEIETYVLVTAQHREMLDQILELYNVKPDFDLDIMKKQQTLTDITVNVLPGIEKVLKELKPDLVLVHGDTSTTFVGALAAFYAQIPVGHVEAGLRTYNIYEPFPEEMNRLLTSRIADIHFAPTSLSKKNLLKENINENNIFVTGNTDIDGIKTTVRKDYTFKYELLNNLDYNNTRVITMTAHRRENLGEPLENICKATLRLVEEHEDVQVVYAVHLNPVVQETAKKILGNNPRIHLVPPLDMEDLHNLMANSYMIMTDSGGLQEEGPALGKPVIVLRGVTERPEGVEAGTLRLSGSDEENIFNIGKELLNNKSVYDDMCGRKNPFGDGNASQRIVQAILYRFGFIKDRPDEFII